MRGIFHTAPANRRLVFQRWRFVKSSRPRHADPDQPTLADLILPGTGRSFQKSLRVCLG